MKLCLLCARETLHICGKHHRKGIYPNSTYQRVTKFPSATLSTHIHTHTPYPYMFNSIISLCTYKYNKYKSVCCVFRCLLLVLNIPFCPLQQISTEQFHDGKKRFFGKGQPVSTALSLRSEARVAVLFQVILVYGYIATHCLRSDE